MVTRAYISAFLISLTLFACGSRKKQVRQEHERTEQTAAERTVESSAVRSERDKRTLELVDSEGMTATTLYGAEGTIGPDGSFTGKADSAKTVSSSRERKTIQTDETEQQDSVGTSVKEGLNQVITDEGKTSEDVKVTRPLIPWWLWLCIAVLVAFSLWFGVWKRGLSNWVYKLFKRVIK